jgi:perosamine synthetase
VQAICAAGARPVFCEVRPDTITIDVADALARVTSRTRAIMPVHYGGRVCDLDALLPAARARGLEVVEDAAQAFGSSRNGTPVGALGELACFSFDPLKNVTCVEGGAVATSRAELARRLRSLRSLGTDRDSWTRFGSDRPWAYTVVSQGFRYWLSDVNAAIGLAQLGRLDAMRARKLEIARIYGDALDGLSGIDPIAHDPDETFPFLYTVRVLDGRRDALVEHLGAAGIDAWVRPLPNHLQPAFPGSVGDLPVSERLFGELMTLPFYVELTGADCERVIAAVRSFFGEQA